MDRDYSGSLAIRRPQGRSCLEPDRARPDRARRSACCSERHGRYNHGRRMMFMRKHSPSQRAAFTLLEMMLSLSIGILLMVGLYFALDLNLHATNTGREQVDQA